MNAELCWQQFNQVNISLIETCPDIINRKDDILNEITQHRAPQDEPSKKLINWDLRYCFTHRIHPI